MRADAKNVPDGCGVLPVLDWIDTSTSAPAPIAPSDKYTALMVVDDAMVNVNASAPDPTMSPPEEKVGLLPMVLPE